MLDRKPAAPEAGCRRGVYLATNSPRVPDGSSAGPPTPSPPSVSPASAMLPLASVATTSGKTWLGPLAGNCCAHCAVPLGSSFASSADCAAKPSLAAAVNETPLPRSKVAVEIAVQDDVLRVVEPGAEPRVAAPRHGIDVDPALATLAVDAQHGAHGHKRPVRLRTAARDGCLALVGQGFEDPAADHHAPIRVRVGAQQVAERRCRRSRCSRWDRRWANSARRM